jgi:gamma-glutamylcyclotransferase (GGCT)/AIG2-like uncharacterized protein YtfP
VLAKPGQVMALFVYGSLLDPVRREEIIGRQLEAMPATLHEYELGRGRYFYIRKCPGSRTPGLLILNLTSHDFEVLDCYEEIPRLYTREKVEVVEANGNSLRSWVYLPTTLTLAGYK